MLQRFYLLLVVIICFCLQSCGAQNQDSFNPDDYIYSVPSNKNRLRMSNWGAIRGYVMQNREAEIIDRLFHGTGDFDHVYELLSVSGHVCYDSSYIKNVYRLKKLVRIGGHFEKKEELKVIEDTAIFNFGRFQNLRLVGIGGVSLSKKAWENIVQAKGIQVLSITGGRIPDCVCELKNLKHIIAPERIILPDCLKKLPNLEFIQAGGGSNVWELSNIKELHIMGRIDSIPASIKKMKRLKELTFYESEVKYFPSEFGELKNLETLRLLSNYDRYEGDDMIRYYDVPGFGSREEAVSEPPYTAFPDDLRGLTSLKTVYLQDVYLRSVPNFSGTPLETLMLYDCYGFQELPGNIVEAKQLKSIVIKNKPSGYVNEYHDVDTSGQMNLFHRLPENIGDMKNLEALVIYEGSRFKQLPESLGDLEKLRVLKLQNFEKLIQPPRQILRLKNLQILSVNSRGLSKPLCDSLLLASPKLERINLRNIITRRKTEGELPEGVINDAWYKKPFPYLNDSTVTDKPVYSYFRFKRRDGMSINEVCRKYVDSMAQLYPDRKVFTRKIHPQKSTSAYEHRWGKGGLGNGIGSLTWTTEEEDLQRFLIDHVYFIHHKPDNLKMRRRNPPKYWELREAYYKSYITSFLTKRYKKYRKLL